jgi:hypothetical protein
LKAFVLGLIRFYPLNPLFPRSIKVLSGSDPAILPTPAIFLRMAASISLLISFPPG